MDHRQTPQVLPILLLVALLIGYGCLMIEKSMRQQKYAQSLSRDIATDDLEIESLTKRMERIKQYQMMLEGYSPDKEAQLSQDLAHAEALRKETIAGKRRLEQERDKLLGTTSSPH